MVVNVERVREARSKAGRLDCTLVLSSCLVGALEYS